MIMKLQVQHQRIQGVRQISRPVIEGSRHFVFLDLTFDKDWDGLTITVAFSNDRAPRKDVEVPWTGEPLEVPGDLLVEGILRIACAGVSDDGYRIATKYMSDGIRVHRAGEQADFGPEPEA